MGIALFVAMLGLGGFMMLGIPPVQGFVAATTGALTMGLLGLNDHLQLDLTLQAAETNNKGKVISAPRVVTLNNREAKIAQGTAIRAA